MQVTCMQTLYKYKQDKYPPICNCTCTCNYDYNYNYFTYYLLYKYLLEYSPEAYILESFALVVKQCK
jgi:hypothetical protein